MYVLNEKKIMVMLDKMELMECMLRKKRRAKLNLKQIHKVIIWFDKFLNLKTQTYKEFKKKNIRQIDMCCCHCPFHYANSKYCYMSSKYLRNDNVNFCLFYISGDLGYRTASVLIKELNNIDLKNYNENLKFITKYQKLRQL